MRILIDLQACQSTGSRTRGIGRYSFSLAHAMLKHSSNCDIHVLMNEAFPESILDLRARFKDLIPNQNFHTWKGVMPAAEMDVNNRWRLRASEFIREQAIREIAPDIVHVSSLFEGLGDAAVTSIASESPYISVVTLYDLIPLINAKPYLENPQVRAWYFRKVQALKNADLLLAISESSRQEGLDHLHLPPQKVINISSAVDERFTAQNLFSDDLSQLRNKYGLSRPFIMYTGGIDLRKNIEGLIEAYASLPSSLRCEYQLAIVCSIQEHDRERLQRLAHKLGLADADVMMTGFVPDEDLPKLYRACSLFVFPSWHEGFGLPALEAMACGAAVIAANTSSLPEVIGRADALFDPYHRDAIARKIEEVLTNPSIKQSLIEHGLIQSRKFSWEASAKTAIHACEQAYQEKLAKQNLVAKHVVTKRKPRLAYFSPLPPSQSGIADYSAELLPELARHYDIEVIVDQNELSDAWISANFPHRSLQWFEKHHTNFSRVLYNFGNSMFHDYMLDAMVKFPGVVVLHDFYHSGLIAHLDLTGQKVGIWDRALYLSHGYAALFEKKLTQDLEQIKWKYPCNQLVLDNADGVIVHSSFSKEMAKKWYGSREGCDWKLIQHLRVLPQKITREKARRSLGLADKDFLICSFGILGPTKLNHLLLGAWLNSSLASDQQCHLIFVGKNDGGEYGRELVETINRSGIASRIKITGFADLDLFRAYLQAADAAVQLRGLSRGETSGTVLDCMAYGVPTIVNNNGSMAELPNEAVIKLPETVEESQITEQIEILFANPQLREHLSSTGRAHIADVHHPYQIGNAYFEAVESFYATSPSISRRRCVQQLAAIEAPFSDADLRQAAMSLSSNRGLSGRKRLLVNCESFRQLANAIQLRTFLCALLTRSPNSWRIEPVCFDKSEVRLAAKQFESILNIHSDIVDVLDAEYVDLFSSDVFLTFESEASPRELDCELKQRMQILGIPIFNIPLSEIESVDAKQLLAMVEDFWCIACAEKKSAVI